MTEIKPPCSGVFQVMKIAYKFEVVGKIASEQVSTVHSSELIAVGLISAESKYKATLHVMQHR